MEKVLPYQRGKQVIHLLSEHGPLSLSGMRACLSPPIQRKRLYEVLSGLIKGGVVEKKQTNCMGKMALFYRLALKPEQETHFRRADFVHSESCAIWKEAFKHLVPQAQVLRDFEFNSHPVISQILMSQTDDYETRPDLMLLLRGEKASPLLAIAVEIERTRKSKSRIVRKLKKYATQTKLDGLIYVCEETPLKILFQDLYESRVLSNALRIKHYGKNFFMFVEHLENARPKRLEMANRDGQRVFFDDWMHKLLSEPIRLRRDQNFNIQDNAPGRFLSKKSG